MDVRIDGVLGMAEKNLGLLECINALCRRMECKELADAELLGVCVEEIGELKGLLVEGFTHLRAIKKG